MNLNFKIIIISFFAQSLILSSEIKSIDIVTTNDIHGVIGEQMANFMNPQYPPKILGGNAMYKYVDDLKKNNEILMLDGGNFFQGNPLGTLDSGAFMIDWYNKLGYDAIVPGRYDFILGTKNLNKLIEMAEFPFLAANLKCNDCDLNSSNIKPFVIKKIDDVNIGILGIVSSALNDWVLSKNLKGIEIDYEAKALKEWIPKIKEAGADVVIVLTSAGVPWDREKVYENFRYRIENDKVWSPSDTTLNAIQMAYYAENVDIIISGGESKGYPLPFYDPNSHVYTFQNYGNGTEFGHFYLNIETNNNIFVGYEPAVKGRVSQTTLSDDFDSHIKMKKLIDKKVQESLNQIYTNVIDWNDIDTKNKSCGYTKNSSYDNWEVPSFNTEENIEIVTWNCEFFPAEWEETIKALGELILDIDADIYAFQEIRYTGWFSKLMELLPNYDFIISHQSSFMEQAIVYRKDMFHLVRQVEPFADNDYNFAGRPPLRGDFWYMCGQDSMQLSIIDIHSKCCDSGLQRRKFAADMLHNYVSKELENGYSNFIILGDWNDDLRDLPGEHSFQSFFDDDRFYFVNLEIINDPKQVTYPKEPYVSFLDHILVTRELIKDSNYYVQTLPIPDYMGGYENYEKLVSDHLPVIFRFPPK